MSASNVSKLTKEIQSRFFIALEALKQAGKVKSLQAFCAEHGLSRARLSNVKNHGENPEDGTGYKFLSIDSFAILVSAYGVSAEWLMTGKGEMFTK